MGMTSNAIFDMNATQPKPPNRTLQSCGPGYYACTEVDDLHSPRTLRSTNFQSCIPHTPFTQTCIAADTAQTPGSGSVVYSCGSTLSGSSKIANPVRNIEHQISPSARGYGLNAPNESLPQGPCDNRDSAFSDPAVSRGPGQEKRAFFGALSSDTEPNFGVNPAADMYIEDNTLQANVANAFNLDNVFDLYSWTQ